MDYSMILILVVMVAVFYFMIIRPEKKKKKEEENLRNSLKEGDKITTIGGIVGKIVDIKGDNIVIETSMDRVRMELAKWSVMTNNTAQEAAQKARAEEDLAGARSGKIDEELFVQFLQQGATLTDEDLVDAFVYQAIVSTEDVVVTLNFDNEKGEPVRLDVEQVLPNVLWLPG